MIVVALHGFFGVPSDWSVVAESLPELEFVMPDLSVWSTRAEVKDFESFARSLNRSVRVLSSERSESVMIAGYSLGGRLAAACLLSDPELYRAALLISVNPGLSESDESSRQARLDFDFSWANRMRLAPWAETWHAWNQQEVLKPGTRIQRASEKEGTREKKLTKALAGRREAWARAMEIWSLGRQPDQRQALIEWTQPKQALVRPLTVMTGTEDQKFTDLTRNWIQPDQKALETIRHRLVLGAGHRVLLEAPEDVASEISSLLKSV